MTELWVYATSAIGGIPSQVYWLLLAVFCAGVAGLLWWKGLSEGLRYGVVLLLAEWVLLVLSMAVLFRETRAVSSINLIPLSSYFDYGENSYFMEKAALNILNVVLFIPVGLLLGFGFKRMKWQKVLLIGIGLSVSVELLQLVFRKGLCEIDDVIHNVIGCMMGYGVAFLLTRIGTNRA